jgi:hypothetical protein
MRSLALTLPALLLAPFAAFAQDSSASDSSFLVPYIGIFDVADDENTTQLGLEYRFADIGYGFRPTVGANVDDESAAYVYGGLNWDLPLGYNVTLTPNVMAGLYHDGASKDLGGAIQFRSGLELSYAFENESRVGIAYNHISNASIYDRNPGAETLLINYQIPMNWMGE